MSGPAAAKPSLNLAINGFRGLCVLMVFAYHVANSGLPGLLADSAHHDAPLSFFASSWRYGVELFFMISGFVIVGSLQRHGQVGAFLRDRFIRIFPAWIPLHLALFTMGAVLGLKLFAGMDAAQMVLVFFTNLLLLAPLLPIGVTHPASWSLSYEWLFYFMAAAGFYLLARRPHRAMIPLLLWATLIACLLYWLPRALFFVPGVMVALGWTPFTKWPQLLRWPAVSLLVFLCAWRVVNVDQASPGAYSLIEAFETDKLWYVLLAFTAALHLFACVSADNASVRVLRTLPLQFLGTISYSFYLWHPVAMFLVKRPVEYWLLPAAGGVLSVVVFTIASLLVGIAAAWLSYQWFEQRLGRALKRWLDGSPTSRAARQVPVAAEGR